MPEPGGNVTYTLNIHNNSAAESITISSLTDVIDGGAPIDVTSIVGTTCALPHAIPAGGSYQCTFTLAVTGDHSTTPTVSDTVTAAGHDDDQNETSAEGSESVDITDVAPSIGVTKVAGVPSVYCTWPSVSGWGMPIAPVGKYLLYWPPGGSAKPAGGSV